MTKRIHDQKEEGVVSKSRPAVTKKSSFIATSSSSTASSPIASKSPVMPIASGKPNRRMSIEPSSFDAASTSQVRLKDAYLGGLMEKQRLDPSHQEEDEDSEDSDNSAAETWYYKGESGAQNEASEQLLAHWASSSVDEESQKNTEATWDHYLQISPDTSHFLGVFSMVRKIYGKQPGDPTEDLNVNLTIWGIFMNTLRPAVHLGKRPWQFKRHDKNLRFKTETEKQISGHTETAGISLINFQDLRWMSTSLLHSRAYQYSTAKVYVFSDSVLCLGKMGDNPVESWKKQIHWYSDHNYFSELNRIDGQPMEFAWKIFPGFTTVAILKEIQRVSVQRHCTGRKRKHRGMFSEFNWSFEVRSQDSLRSLVILGTWIRKGTKTCSDKPDGNWDRTADMMILQLTAESGHPIFRASSAPLKEEI